MQKCNMRAIFLKDNECDRPKRQNSTMTDQSDEKQSPCWASDFEKYAFCRKEQFS